MSSTDLTVELDERVVVVEGPITEVVVDNDEHLVVELYEPTLEVFIEDPGAVEIVTIGAPGARGERGERGEQGPPGPPGAPGDVVGAASHLHFQEVPSAVWVIAHPLPFTPNITTVDTSRSEIVGVVNYLDDNTVTVSFSSPTAGRAFLS